MKLLFIVAFFVGIMGSTAPANAVGSEADNLRSEVQEEVREARALIDAERYEEAIGYLSSAIAATPGEAEFYNLIGYAHRLLGQLDAAGMAYDTALEIDPQHEGALEYQGELFVALGLMDLAKANLTKLQNVCGQTCNAYLDLDAAIRAADQ